MDTIVEIPKTITQGRSGVLVDTKNTLSEKHSASIDERDGRVFGNAISMTCFYRSFGFFCVGKDRWNG
jgi:hypothetical protein